MTQGNMKINHKYLSTVIIFFISTLICGQHRGDNLSFQGLNGLEVSGIKTSAMGGANIAGTSDVSSIFGNPAGLIGLKSFQITIGANNYQKQWWENQDYRSNRQFATLPFYLDGMYIPNPANNGKFDYDAFFTDLTYKVADPALGKDPFSSDAADWKRDKSEFAFNNIALAIPFKLFKKDIVVAASYSRNKILDYDRDQTYLDPDIGFSGYGGLVPRVVAAGQIVHVNWSDYSRSRTGSLNQITIAAAANILDFLKLGLSANITSGKSDDFRGLSKIGYFDLIGSANSFKFSYDTLNTSETGTSTYKAFNLSFGAVISLDRINIGIKLRVPYTFERTYNLTQNITGKNINQTNMLTGTDKAKYPLGVSIGASFMPIDQFRIAFDIENTPYSKTEFELSSPDSTFRQMANQTIIKIGAEYKVLDFLSILAGFRNSTELFIPDGAAVKDSGPNSKSYTLGLSLDIPYGRLDLAYEYKIMKYYDSYYSNTNYVTETFGNFMVGYTFTF